MAQLDDEAGTGSADLFERNQVRNCVRFVMGSIRRRRKLVVVVISSIWAMTIIALLSLPKSYHVEAKLMAQRNQVLAVRGDGPDAAPTRGAVETVQRRDNLVAIVKSTDLVRHYSEHRALGPRLLDRLRHLGRPADSEQDQIDGLVEMLEKRLVVWVSEGTVTISIDWPDAQMAARLVDTAQQNFLEQRYAQEITALSESTAIVAGYAVRLQADIDSAVAGIEKLRADREPVKPSTMAAPEATATPAARAPGAPAPRPVAHRPSEPRSEPIGLKVAIDAKQRALDDLEDIRRRRLAETQAHLAEQLATYTENHPTVIDLKQQVATLSVPAPQVKVLREEIAAMQADRARDSGAVRDEPAPVAAGASPRAARSAGAPVTPPPLSNEILRLDQQLREDRDPATVYARAQLRDAMDKYSALRTQVQGAQIELETAEAAFKYRYSVLTPAQIPKRPMSPNVPMVLIAALFAAFVAAALIAVVAEVRQGRVVERWQIEHLLDRPVLGELTLPQLPSHTPK